METLPAQADITLVGLGGEVERGKWMSEDLWLQQQLAFWRGQHEQYLADAAAKAIAHQTNQQRRDALPEILHLLERFLESTLSLQEFNQIFQRKARQDWFSFHLKGMSGGMFLNKLIKYIHDEEHLTHLLRLLLRIPKDGQDGQRAMQTCIRFLEGLLAAEHVTRLQLQPARVPFFLSAWWHMQDREQWPLFYTEVRDMLLKRPGDDDAHLQWIQDPVMMYGAFRSRFCTLACELGLSSWELEHLVRWSGTHQRLQEGKQARARSSSLREEKMTLSQALPSQLSWLSEPIGIDASGQGGTRILKKEKRSLAHRTSLQWLLAKIGQKVHCQTWIAVRDHGAVWKNECLGQLSLERLPHEMDALTEQIMQHIAVLWFLKQEVVAAYEIVHTPADVPSALLRLYDVGMLFPKREIVLCLVTPQEQLEPVQFALARPLFGQHMMRKRCVLLSEELLIQHAEHILRWAHSPLVLQDLIAYATYAPISILPHQQGHLASSCHSP